MSRSTSTDVDFVLHEIGVRMGTWEGGRGSALWSPCQNRWLSCEELGCQIGRGNTFCEWTIWTVIAANHLVASNMNKKNHLVRKSEILTGRPVPITINQLLYLYFIVLFLFIGEKWSSRRQTVYFFRSASVSAPSTERPSAVNPSRGPNVAPASHQPDHLGRWQSTMHSARSKWL